jgi:hypothetical protein
MSQTDAQAALAAAARVMAQAVDERGMTPELIEQHTLRMADAFLSWLRGYGRATVTPDERLVPNEDFRSPSQARTERVDPSAVLAAAADPTMPWRTVSGAYVGPHVRGGPACVTPSGAYACLCGEKWPCSQSDAYRRRVELDTP